jgi:hypothetical protein
MTLDEAKAVMKSYGGIHWPSRWPHWVGEEIDFTRMRKWWEFWKPRFEQVRGTVVQVTAINASTDKVIVKDVVLQDLSNRHIQGLDALKRRGITGDYLWTFDRAGQRVRRWSAQLHHLFLTGDWRWLISNSTHQYRWRGGRIIR